MIDVLYDYVNVVLVFDFFNCYFEIILIFFRFFVIWFYRIVERSKVRNSIGSVVVKYI